MTYSPSVSSATDFAANPDNYVEILSSLQSGDTLKLAPGTYASGLDIYQLNGYEGRWITIEGPVSGEAAVFLGRTDRSTVTIRDSSYVRLIGLHLVADETNPKHGIELLPESEYAHHITIQELHIRGFKQSADSSAIITRAPVWDWDIRLNTIEDVGTGLSLGNKNQPSQFIRGNIEQNVILQAFAYAIFIGQQNGRPDIIGVPQQSSSIYIRDNVMSKSGVARTNATGRPMVLLERQSETGFSENDNYQIYGNFFYENEFVDQALIVAEGNVKFHNNILVNSNGSGAKFGSSSENLRELECFNNTVLVQKNGIFLENPNAGFEQRIVGNAVFAQVPITNPNGLTEKNFTDAYISANQFLENPENFNYYPKRDQLEGSQINLEYYNYLRAYNMDFNGEIRRGSTRGAYVDNGGNSGWRIHLGRKNRDVRSNQDAGLSDASNQGGKDSTYSGPDLADAGQSKPDAAAIIEKTKDANCSCNSSSKLSILKWELFPCLVFLLVIARVRKAKLVTT